MGRVLRLHSVVEGIENEAGLEGVRTLGGDVEQGYHLERPMSATEVRALISGVSPEAVMPSTPGGSSAS